MCLLIVVATVPDVKCMKASFYSLKEEFSWNGFIHTYIQLLNLEDFLK